MGPLAVAAVLEAVDAGLEMGREEALLLEANHFGLLSSTADMREGMQAFLEKRAARFRGPLSPLPRLQSPSYNG